MKLSDYVIDDLANKGITHIFEVCGGALAHLLDSVYGRSDITTVSMHHEMAAAIAAEGYARASENFGVAMATSGPGATNMITGIASCYFDSIPCLFITGQVNTYEYKYDRHVRQEGFQETDIVSITRPVTKLSWMIDDANEICDYMDSAYRTMHTLRKGPVLLDIPLNIQRTDVPVDKLKHYPHEEIKKPVADWQYDVVIDAIKDAERPIILVGGGVRSSKSCDYLRQFAHTFGFPVVSSLMGLDAFPHTDPLYVGMIGTYGNRYANLAIANADLVIALGTRLDTRQTGTKPETFARNAKIIHIDIDLSELHHKIAPHIGIQTDIKTFLKGTLLHTTQEKPGDYKGWLKKINQYKKKYPNYSVPKNNIIETANDRRACRIDPNYFMHVLSDELADNAIVCVDVGQIQMWAAQSLVLKQDQRFLTQGGMASIGSALPMAIGAAFAKPKNQIVVICGDGGFQLNIQELQTIYHHNLPIKMIMLNNNGYGMIKQFQEQYMNSRFQSTGIGYSNPNFKNVVRAYEINAASINENEAIQNMVEFMLKNDGPQFLEVIIDEKAKALPKLSVNRPVEDQEPLLSREELKENMIIEPYQEESK